MFCCLCSVADSFVAVTQSFQRPPKPHCFPDGWDSRPRLPLCSSLTSRPSLRSLLKRALSPRHSQPLPLHPPEPRRHRRPLARTDGYSDIDPQCNRALTDPDRYKSTAATATATSVRSVEIITVNKPAEYVDIQNFSPIPVDLLGWRLVSETGNQSCDLRGTLAPNEILRIWTHRGNPGFDCRLPNDIWRDNVADPAVLYNSQGEEVSKIPLTCQGLISELLRKSFCHPLTPGAVPGELTVKDARRPFTTLACHRTTCLRREYTFFPLRID